MISVVDTELLESLSLLLQKLINVFRFRLCFNCKHCCSSKLSDDDGERFNGELLGK
jgi:hypothetical protein